MWLRVAVAAIPSQSDDRLDGVNVDIEEDEEVSVDGNDEDGGDDNDDIMIVVRAWGADVTWRDVVISTPGSTTKGTEFHLERRAAHILRRMLARLIVTLFYDILCIFFIVHHWIIFIFCFILYNIHILILSFKMRIIINIFQVVMARMVDDRV